MRREDEREEKREEEEEEERGGERRLGRCPVARLSLFPIRKEQIEPLRIWQVPGSHMT